MLSWLNFFFCSVGRNLRILIYRDRTVSTIKAPGSEAEFIVCVRISTFCSYRVHILLG